MKMPRFCRYALNILLGLALWAGSDLVWADIQVTTTQNISFGTLVKSGGAATVTISPDNSISTTGSVTFLAGHQRGILSITGTPSDTFVVDAIADTTVANNGNTLSVDTFTVDPVSAMFDSGGLATIYLGARLNLPAGALTSGDYAGSVTITINYQ